MDTLRKKIVTTHIVIVISLSISRELLRTHYYLKDQNDDNNNKRNLQN